LFQFYNLDFLSQKFKVIKKRHWPPLTIQEVKTALFRVITQRVVVIAGGRAGGQAGERAGERAGGQAGRQAGRQAGIDL
jgi:hypothetical protein